ncbi:phospholipase [Amycolatopsis sp. CA-230715]|uniref:phospholipase n=1 Tax=Amycolatopsis sp. CA-230715 TaxID=2745196 RepID=UPI001C01F58A|nr:phospholipase [Amycolatopsis sp. CA-230715]QWF77057.1 hypothetical protein HUW46_00437 [Amycolatopsis sp. CA-230715]
MTLSTLHRRIATVAVGLATAGIVSTGTAQADNIQTITDNYLFSTSLSNFEKIRDSKPYPGQLDWSSDACSWSPDKPVGFDFKPGCHRHDFGYRNYKKQGRFNATSKKKIDDNFYSDLKGICKGNVACNGIAWIYYQAVRKLGS